MGINLSLRIRVSFTSSRLFLNILYLSFVFDSKEETKSHENNNNKIITNISGAPLPKASEQSTMGKKTDNPFM